MYSKSGKYFDEIIWKLKSGFVRNDLNEFMCTKLNDLNGLENDFVLAIRVAMR